MNLKTTTLIVASLWIGMAITTQAQQPEAMVELATVTEQQSSSVATVPGTVISTRDAEIAAEISGRLTWVAQVGKWIEKGQPLARIDDHLLQLQLRNDEAEIARLEADIQYNKRQIQRLQKLAQQNNMAKSELDEVESRLEMLVQEQRIAAVERDRTRYDLERTQVRAPFAGVVASREFTIGEYTTPGESLLRLVDTKALEISVNAPLRVARYNQTGSQVQVRTMQHQMMSTIRGTVPVGDARSRMMELRLSLDAGTFLIGEAVTVELPDGDPSPALSVPRDALVLREEQIFVYTVSADNTAVKVPVSTLAGRGSRIAVKGDLAPGDRVVIRGAERLRDGQALKVLTYSVSANS